MNVGPRLSKIITSFQEKKTNEKPDYSLDHDLAPVLWTSLIS